MKTIIKTAIISALLLLPLLGFGQKSWTLEECIGHALQNNIQLQRSALRVESAQRDVTQSTFQLGPNISGFYNHNYLKGTTFNQYSLKFESMENQYGNLGIASEITLFDGLYSINNRTRLKYQLEAIRQDAEVLKNNVTLNVVASFLQVLMDTEQYKLAEKQLEISQNQLNKAEAQLKLGTISQSDYLNIKAQSINQQALKTSMANRLNYSTIELAHLLELDSPDDFKIDLTPVTMSDSHEILAFNNLYQQIAEKRPEIRKAEFDVKSAQKNLSMAYGLLSPRVALGYQMGTGYNQRAWYISPDGNLIEYPDYTYGQQMNDYLQHMVYFRVSIPIFQRLSYHTNISKSKLNLLDAKYAREEAQKYVYKDIQIAFADAQASWDNYLAYRESVDSFRELYDQTLRRFELGTVSALDVGIAQNNLIKAEGELLHAKYTYLLRVKILDFYRGVPISL